MRLMHYFKRGYSDKPGSFLVRMGTLLGALERARHPRVYPKKVVSARQRRLARQNLAKAVS
jgi:hypothetical protein